MENKIGFECNSISNCFIYLENFITSYHKIARRWFNSKVTCTRIELRHHEFVYIRLILKQVFPDSPQSVQ